ncbi:MAG: sigma-54-dependent Fis family transcriptional regulator, partial [Lentisphaeria bacterium]|nr:sigma-54-dependent Fis family transcriptional regulator [Lentisphaeria bacterium]
MNAHIAIIDDDPLILELCQDFLESQDYTHTLINDSMEAFEIIKGNVPDLVITDIEMPNKSGLELLEEIKAEFPNLPVLVLSGRGTIQTAVQAIQLGADDYVSKPFHPQQFLLRIKTVLHKQELTVENEDLKKQLEVHKAGKSIIGNSRLMQKVFNVIERAAPTDANVLICGESGTGKEMVARELHNLSKRSKNPFIPVDCVAIPTHLIESELFGHEKGSFTGAIDRKIGLFETAKNGSIFLDEITELDIDLQSKLLRVLQERKFRRVGGNDYIDLNARIISATNRDPEQAVQENTFRLDLFYRLNVIPVDLP